MTKPKTDESAAAIVLPAGDLHPDIHTVRKFTYVMPKRMVTALLTGIILLVVSSSLYFLFLKNAAPYRLMPCTP